MFCPRGNDPAESAPPAKLAARGAEAANAIAWRLTSGYNRGVTKVRDEQKVEEVIWIPSESVFSSNHILRSCVLRVSAYLRIVAVCSVVEPKTAFDGRESYRHRFRVCL